MIALAAIWYVGFFFVVSALRAGFPLELEWVESGVLDSVGRVIAHLPVYAAPTHVYVPYLYTPFYYYAAAALCRAGGLGFAPLRWLSIGCTLGCLLLIFLQTKALTGSRIAALASAACFAAFYGASAGSYDLGRVDMLYVLLALAAIYAALLDHAVLAALLFACAYQTKQGAAIIAICVFAGMARRPWQAIQGLLTFFALTGLLVLALNRASGGWYAFYTQWLPSHQPIVPGSILSFVARDLGRYAAPAILLIVLCARKRLTEIWQSRRGNLLLGASLGCFLTALAGRLHSGGSANSSIPLFAWLAVLFGVAAWRIRNEIGQPASRSMRLAIALVGCQFLISISLPWRYVPSHQERIAADRFLRQIADTPGDIYVVNGAAALAPAHKTSFANGVTVWDVVRAGDSPAERAMLADLAQAIHRRSYSALLAPSPMDGGQGGAGMPPDLAAYYDLTAPPLRSGAEARALEVKQTPHIAPVYLFPAQR